MKPLELHIYDKHPATDAYRVGGFYSPYCLVSRDKRFQPGELAAECWKAKTHFQTSSHQVDTFGPSAYLVNCRERTREHLVTLDRFASLPHYDEADQ